MFFNLNSKAKANWFWLLPFTVYILFWGFWFKADNTPPHWDGGRHVYNAENYFTLFKNIVINTKENGRTDALAQLLSQYFYYPPFQYYLTIPFLVIFGVSAKSALLVNLAWISLLTFGVVKFLKQFNLSNLAIFGGLCLIFGSPFLIGQSREYQLDYPTLAFLFLAFWRLEVLLKDFNAKNSIYLGTIFATGILTKWTFLITFTILAIPVVLIRIFSHFQNTFNFEFNFIQLKTYFQKILVNLFALFFTTWGIISLWYIPNLSHLIIDFKKNAGSIGIIEGDPQGFGWDSLFFYANALTSHYFTFVWILALALLAIIWFTQNRKKLQFSSRYLTLLSYLLGFTLNLFYLMIQGNKDTRYAVGFFVFFVLIIAFGINDLSSKLQKYSTIIMAFCALLFIICLNVPSNNIPRSIAITPKVNLEIIPTSGYTNLPTNNQQWAVYQVLELAQSNSTQFWNSSDNCITKDYWKPLPSIKVDFEDNPTHSNYGTVWGLAREYGLEISDSDNACFILIGSNNQEYLDQQSQKIQDYQPLGQFNGVELKNIMVLAKKI